MAKKKKRYRIKKGPIIFLLILIIGIVGGIYGYKKYQEKINSDEYKLTELGYSETEISGIVSLEREYIDIILGREYNKFLPEIFKEKYFILENLDKYLSYKAELNNKDTPLSQIVAYVNTRANEEFYSNPKPTDLSKGYLMIVNKFNYLEEGYEPEDLTKMGLQYAFSGKTLREEVYESFKGMVKDAKALDLTIVANSAFRDYDYQNKLYNDYKDSRGKKYADSYAARAGYSEHQTGLAIDVSTLNSTLDNFDETEEFLWLKDHAHEYGFILRYPEDKEEITGYNYEPWHYRYVGVEVATEIKNLGITFDEYYAYYLK